MSPQEAFELTKRKGDKAAAIAYAEHLLDANPDMLAQIKAQCAKDNPVIVPVDGMEFMQGQKVKYNPIPLAFASVLGERTGWEVDGINGKEPIQQSNMAGRTGAEKVERFVRQAEFAGPVQAGRNYLIVDDHFTVGGTLRNLMDHIEAHGGKVVCASTLIRGGPNSQFRPTQKDIARARQAIGYNNYDALHQSIFGVDSSHCLYTSGELKSFTTANNLLVDEYKNRNEVPPYGKTLQDELFQRIGHELQEAAAARRHAAREALHAILKHAPGLAAYGRAAEGVDARESISPGAIPADTQGGAHQETRQEKAGQQQGGLTSFSDALANAVRKAKATVVLKVDPSSDGKPDSLQNAKETPGVPPVKGDAKPRRAL